MEQARNRTDWPSLLSSLAIQFVLVGWLVWMALRPSPDHDEVILNIVVLLLPFELVRVILLTMLSSVYRDYKDRWQAVKRFLGGVVVFTVFALVVAILPGRGRDPFASAHALARPWIWVTFIGPVAVLVLENAGSLFLFQGNARRQAALLDAMSSDSWDWLSLGFFVGAIIGALCMLMRPTEQALFQVFLIYAAIYFGTKGILLSNVYTARFASTGQRVFGSPRAIKFFSKKEDLGDKLSKEQMSIEWRRAAMSP